MVNTVLCAIVVNKRRCSLMDLWQRRMRVSLSMACFIARDNALSYTDTDTR